MNKSDLINKISAATGDSKASVSRQLEATVAVITDALKGGEAVEIRGFGNFSVVEQAARKGRNPQTGAEIDIDARNKAVFKAGTDLKNAVNGGM